jgi:hypothetical protein
VGKKEIMSEKDRENEKNKKEMRREGEKRE